MKLLRSSDSGTVFQIDMDAPLYTEEEFQLLMELDIVLNSRPDDLPKRILLIGRPSAGKSSLINLLRAALARSYEEVAPVGSAAFGDGAALTEHIVCYENMGLSDDELRTFRESRGYAEDVRLPTLMDMPGIDECMPNTEYVLKYVLDGAIPDGVPVLPALRSEKGMSKLVSRMDFQIENMQRRKVDRVIFVISLPQDVPVPLLSTAMKLICNTNGERRVIPFIMVFTHLDRVGKIDGVTQERARATETTAAGVVGRSRNLINNCHKLSNYSDSNQSSTNAGRYDIDLPLHMEALRTICKALRPKRIIDDLISVTRWTPKFDYYRRLVARMKPVIAKLLGILAVLFFAFVVAQNTKVSYSSGRAGGPRRQ